MATDVDVQFFSHLNGLTLSNNWGDMIRLLDTCLVNGLPLTSVTSATVDGNGDINLTLSAAHNCLLFQIVELSDFAPSGFNGKYRIKGTPSATTLILKAEKAGQTITTTGTAKLASLGYEIKFRDLSDVKRAYRAIDPTDAHPFIRVDESQSGEGGGTYTSTYAKSAMVGLIENMTSIDDYADTSKLQLPLDTADFKKNWKITGTGTSVVRGWSKWTWAHLSAPDSSGQDAWPPDNGTRAFSLAGDKDAFYLLTSRTTTAADKILYGCGLFDASLNSSVVPNWFLMSTLASVAANTNYGVFGTVGGIPLSYDGTPSRFFVCKYNNATRISPHSIAIPNMPDYQSGYTSIHSATDVPALTIPLADNANYLRGSLKHVHYVGKKMTLNNFSAPVLSDGDMYLYDTNVTNYSGKKIGGFLFYLGAL